MNNTARQRSAKKTLAFLLLTAVCLMSAGCAAEAAVSETVTPKPTLAPTPKPEGLEAVFGKSSVTVTVVSNSGEQASALFFEGARAEAEAMGVTLRTVAAGSGFNNAFGEAAGSSDAFVACLLDKQADQSAIASAGVPVCVYETEKGSVPEGAAHIYYNPAGEAARALDAALMYPPHDTPVRLILMFESRDTESFTLYETLYAEGKIFPKDIYVASEAEGAAPGAWLTEKLDAFVEGMIDGVYAGNTDLAIGALDALESLGRTDMEVFCLGVTPETAERMAANPAVFAQSVGPNEYLAGVLSVRAALKILKDEEAAERELGAFLVNAADLSAGNAAFLGLGGDAAQALSEEWMEALKSYYGTIPS